MMSLQQLLGSQLWPIGALVAAVSPYMLTACATRAKAAKARSTAVYLLKAILLAGETPKVHTEMDSLRSWLSFGFGTRAAENPRLKNPAARQ